MDKMQQEAINRMRDMEKRSKSTSNYYNQPKYDNNEIPMNYNNFNHYNYNYNLKQNQAKNKKEDKNTKVNQKESETKVNNKDKDFVNESTEKNLTLKNEGESKTENLLEELFKDKEKTLILALIALLCTEKTDYVLVLALIYLIV